MPESSFSMTTVTTNLAPMQINGILSHPLMTLVAISFMQHLWKKRQAGGHIAALEAVVLKYGLASAYYVDSHSIFRFVQGRDSFWRKHYSLTD
jgi:hypothetical protein